MRADDVVAPAFVGHFVDDCPAGHALVVAAPPDLPSAVFGGLLAARAVAVGCAGVVTDGRVRDAAELEAHGRNLPVFARGPSVLSARGRSRCATAGTAPVMVDGVPVRWGDVVVADADGVVVVPAERVADVAQACARITETDRNIEQSVREGERLAEAIRRWRT